MAKKIVILIDGGFIRVKARKAGKIYNPAFIEQFAHACNGANEEILRILYYDGAPYSGTVRLPVSGNQFTFAGSDKWLQELAQGFVCCEPWRPKVPGLQSPKNSRESSG